MKTIKTLIVFFLLTLSLISCRKEDDLIHIEWTGDLIHPIELCHVWVQSELQLIQSIEFNDTLNYVRIEYSDSSKTFYNWSYIEENGVICINSEIIINPIVFPIIYSDNDLTIIYEDNYYTFKNN